VACRVPGLRRHVRGVHRDDVHDHDVVNDDDHDDESAADRAELTLARP
jgi:hypothetical protein